MVPVWLEHFCSPRFPVKKKAVRSDRSKRGKRGRKISGKAMQDEVEASAKTLGLEKTTILEEG
jgi:hypothetical protein